MFFGICLLAVLFTSKIYIAPCRDRRMFNWDTAIPGRPAFPVCSGFYQENQKREITCFAIKRNPGGVGRPGSYKQFLGR